MKSIYNFFSKYRSRYVDLALKTFTINESDNQEYSLLIKEFGPLFDGENAVGTDSSEKDAVNETLKKLELRIIIIDTLKKMLNESDQSILEYFKEKDDSEIIIMINSYVRDYHKLRMLNKNNSYKKSRVSKPNKAEHQNKITKKQPKKTDKKITNARVKKAKKDGKFKNTLFDYFIDSEMPKNVQEKIKKLVLQYMDNTSSIGKSIAVRLYTKEYDHLDLNLEVGDDVKKEFDILINDINNFIKLKQTSKNEYKLNCDSYLDYFTDRVATKEENEIVKEAIKDFIDKDNSKRKELVVKYYGPQYNQRNDLKFGEKEYSHINDYKNEIKRKLFFKIVPSFNNISLSKGNYAKENKILAIETLKRLIDKNERIKRIIVKIYGENYDTFNANAIISNYERYILKCFLNDSKIEIKDILNKDVNIKQTNYNFPSYLDYFTDEVATTEENEIVKEAVKDFIDKDTSNAKKLIIKYYGSQYNQRKDLKFERKEYFIIKDYKKQIKRNLFFNIASSFYDISLKGQYNKENKILWIETFKGFIDKNERIKRIFVKIYGEKYDTFNANAAVSNYERYILKQFLNDSKKEINNIINKEINTLKCKFTSYLDYFTDEFATPEENEIVKKAVKDFIDKDNGKRKEVVIKYYGPQYNQGNDLKIERKDYFKINNYKKLIKSNLFFKIVPSFNDISLLKRNNTKENKILAIEKNERIKRIFVKIYGENYDTFNANAIVSNYERYILKQFFDEAKIQIKNEIKEIKVLNRKKVNVIKETNKETNKEKFTNLKSNMLDYYIEPSMTEEEKNNIMNLFDKYVASTTMAGIEIYKRIYDENHQLKAPVKLSKSECKDFMNFRYYFKIFMKSKKNLSNKVSKEQYSANIDMLDLGDNGYIALNNNLFNIELIEQEEKKQGISSYNNQMDNLIKSTYLAMKDSSYIMEILNISEATLLDFYLNNLDNLDDISEAIKFILFTKEKDAIKRLFLTPLFQRVLPYMSYVERQLLYLKMIQVGNEKVTDSIIATITRLPINVVESYTIYTKEDKVNDLNIILSKKQKNEE